MPDTLDSVNSTTIIYCFREAKFTKGSKRSRNKQSRRQERKDETRNRPHLPQVSEPGSCCRWIPIAERKKVVNPSRPSFSCTTILFSHQKSGDENTLCNRDCSILFSRRNSGDENTLCNRDCSIARILRRRWRQGHGRRKQNPNSQKNTFAARRGIWRTRTWVSTKRPG
jgi:hypothetical protein